jgi:hypothetical protein
MKVLVLYRPRSEHRQAVEEFIRRYNESYTDSSLEVLDVDQRDGSATASLYDILQYPGFLILRDDGSVLQSWQGPDNIPKIEDVHYYVTSSI